MIVVAGWYVHENAAENLCSSEHDYLELEGRCLEDRRADSQRAFMFISVRLPKLSF